MRRPFLTLYDYGTGGIWAYISAETPDDILAKFRDVVVYESPPEWMTEGRRREIEAAHSYAIETVEDQHPTFAGLLREG